MIDLKDIESLVKEKQEKSDGLSTSLGELRTKIRNGETTGEKSRDFALMIGSFSEMSELEGKVRSFKNNLDHYKGQLVVFCSYTAECVKESGCFSGASYQYHYDAKMAFLEEEVAFDFKEKKIVLPSRKHAVFSGTLGMPSFNVGCGSRYRPPMGSIVDGPITLEVMDFFGLTYKESYGLSLKLFLGNEYVELFMAMKDSIYEAIFVDISTSVASLRRIYGVNDEKLERVGYFDLLDTLGASSLDTARERKNAVVEKRKRNTLSQILDLTDPSKKEELRRSGYQIEHILKEAVELGLHDQNDIINLIHTPGLKVEVGEYVRGLCKQYKVPFPQP